MKLVVALLLLLACASCLHAQVYSSLVNREVTRDIDLTKNAVRHSIEATIFNSGDKAVSQFHLVLTKEQASKLAYMSVHDGTRNLRTSLSNAATDKDAVLYQVDLRSELKPKDSQKLVIKYVFTHLLEPYPKQIKQSENQKFVLNDNHYFYSPYATTTQKTIIKLPSHSVDAFTEEQPVKRSGDTIIYGPYNNQKPYTASAMRVHYQNNSPFVTVTTVDRLFEVSHWGNLAVEENYVIKHDGAELKGSFSRLDFQRNPMQTAPSSFRALTAVIPINAQDIYFRDEIGNISSSNIRVSSGNKNLEVELLPRYPLFGGWKTKFYFGYNAPLSSFLKVNPEGLYVLTLDFGVPFSSAVVDNQVVRIVLPEGASDIAVKTPFRIDSETRGVHKTYLDTTGRPIITLVKNNVVSEHSQKITITYRFSTVSMLHEPLLLAGALFLFFVAVMVYVRIDIKIAPSEEELSAEKLNELLDQYSYKQIERTELYSSTNNENTKKAIRDTTSEIKNIIESIKSHNAKLANKLAVIESKEAARFVAFDARKPNQKESSAQIHKLSDEISALVDEVSLAPIQ